MSNFNQSRYGATVRILLKRHSDVSFDLDSSFTVATFVFLRNAKPTPVSHARHSSPDRA